MKRNKKGFTIVELVIVIAVIGVLAAVLIPTFINLTNKANEASDNSLVKNLNTALKMVENDTEAEDEDSHEKLAGTNNTMQDVVLDLKYSGYYLDNLIAKSGQDLLWNADTNQFLLNNDPAKRGPNFWQIVREVPAYDNQKYSYYAGRNFNTNVPDLKYGFDAGYNTGIENLKYVGPNATQGQTAVIRTDGGTLKINAPYDSVKHYGLVDSLKIEAIKGNSHHEYGEVKFAEISAGRIAMEAGSSINHIHVNAKVVEEVKQNEFDEIIISKAADVEMPKLSRDDVEIAAEGTLVVALQDGTEEITTSTELDYVWLTKQGIYEQIKVSDNKESAGSTWADSDDVSNETQKAAKEIANNYITDAVRPTWTGGDDATRDLDTISNKTEVATAVAQEEAGEEWSTMTEEQQQAAITEKEAEVVDETKAVEKPADKEDIEIGVVLFAGGTGTQKDPFLIVDYDTMQAINYVSSQVLAESYYKVKDGTSVIDCHQDGRKWSMIYISGHFDGNNVTFTNLDKPLFYYNDFLDGDTVIKNFTISRCNISTGYASAVFYYAHNTRLVNINLDSTCYIEGSTNASSYIMFGYSADYLKIENCHSSATIACCSAYGSGFVGQGLGTAYNKTTSIYLTDSIFDGKISNTSGTYYYAHGASDSKVKAYITNSETFTGDAGLWGTIKGDNSSLDYRYISTESCSVLTKTAGTSPSRYASFEAKKAAGGVKARIEFHISCSANDGTGGYDVIYVSKDIDISSLSQNETFNSGDVIYFDVTVNSGSEAGISPDNKTYNVVNSYYNACDGLSAKMIQYDVNGNIISITTYALAK